MIIRVSWRSLEKIHHSIFWVLQWWSCLSGPLKSMVISVLFKIGTVKFLKNLHIDFITKKLFFQIKKLNESNFFLIIIYILIQFKVFIYCPWKFIWSTGIQNILLLVYWPPHGIAIDHSSIGLKRLTIQLVFIEAWLCVVMRFLHHNTSQVCTATLIQNSQNSLNRSYPNLSLIQIYPHCYNAQNWQRWHLCIISNGNRDSCPIAT